MATQQQLIDLVQIHFSDGRGGFTKGETEILLALNNAVHEFCQDSKIVRELIEITTDGSVEYTLNSRIIQVDEVTQGTTVYIPLQKRPEHYTADQEHVYWIDKGSIHLGTISDGTISALASGLTVGLHCRTKPVDLSEFTALLDSAGEEIYDANGDLVYVYNSAYTGGPSIPNQFHLAPVYRVLADKYLDKVEIPVIERLRMSDKFDSRYRRLLVSAAAWGEANQKGHGFTVTPHSY